MTSSVFNTCNVLYGLRMFYFCPARGPKTMVMSAGLCHTQTATVQIFQQLLKMKLVLSVPRAFFFFRASFHVAT